MTQFTVSNILTDSIITLTAGDILTVTETGYIEQNLGTHAVTTTDPAIDPVRIELAGRILGSDTFAAIYAAGQAFELEVAATGELEGRSSALDVSAHSWASVTNHGLITTDGADAVRFAEQTYAGGLVETDYSVVNTGTISTTGLAISFYSTGAQNRVLSVENSGTITGFYSIFILKSDSTENGDYLDLLNSGDITGTITIIGLNGDDLITNTGTITGEIYLDQGDDEIVNSGTITGDISLANDADRIINSGTIGGDITLGDGNDYYNAIGSGNSGHVFGDAGDDTLLGADSNDVLWGGAGDDLLFGRAGNDTLGADDGEDWIVGGAGFDYLSLHMAVAGQTVDLMDASRNVGLTAGDTIQGVEGIRGTSFDDQLYGSIHANHLTGGAGNDLIFGRNGSDTLAGHQGNDTLDGGIGNDVLRGGADDDLLYGRNGHDVLRGEAGDDTLVGGLGNDSLFGGAGHDVFVFGLRHGRDVVQDLAAGDIVELTGLASRTVEQVIDLYGRMTDDGARLTFAAGHTILFKGADLDLLESSLSLV